MVGGRTVARRTRLCTDCGRSWGGPARFCGRCGAVLAGPPPASGPTGSSRPRPLVLGLGAVLLVGSLVTWGARADLDLPRLTHRADPSVALPDADDVPTGQGPSGAERDAALAPFTPGRFSCQPIGCERWRRPLTTWAYSASAAAGTLAFVESGELVALDLQTGRDLWRAPLARDLEATPLPHDAWGPWGPAVGGNDDLVAVATTAGVQVLTRRGEPLWTSSLELGDHVHQVLVTSSSVGIVYSTGRDTDEAVLDASGEEADDGPSEDWSEPPQHLAVFDARTGAPSWSRSGLLHAYPARMSTADVFAVHEGEEVQILGARDGEIRFATPVSREGWTDMIGDLVLVYDLDDVAMTVRLVDARDGTVRQELPGYLHALTMVDDLTVFLRSDDGPRFGDSDARPGQREAIAIDRDGDIRWRHPLRTDHADDCCPTALMLASGKLRLAAGPGAPARIVDPVSGEVGGEDPLEDVLTSAAEAHWQLGASTVIRHGGRAPAAVFDGDGRRVDLQGTDWSPLWIDFQPGAPVLIHADGHLIALGFR
jgi:outer membrane protein assembly factor BamB